MPIPENWTLENEAEFKKWYAGMSKLASFLSGSQLNPDPDDPEHFYDYRQAFLKRDEWELSKDGHWPSEFKLKGHPRLIIDGIDTRTGKKVK
jgi:hypothetical protein